jgi:hypothetical protein
MQERYIARPRDPILIATLKHLCYSAVVFHTLLISRLGGKETVVDSPYKRLETLE